MSSFFERASTFVKGSANDLLNKIIDLNNPTMLRQYVRDLEGAINGLAAEKVTAEGDLRTLNRQKSELTSAIATQKAVIVHLTQSTDPNAPALAKSKAELVITEQNQLTTFDTQIASTTTQVATLATTVQKLQTKHDQMVLSLSELERLDRDSKSKEHAAHAIQNFSQVGAGVDSTSIDNMRQRILSRNDHASAQFDAAVASVSTGDEDTETSSAADALIASLTATK